MPSLPLPAGTEQEARPTQRAQERGAGRDHGKQSALGSQPGKRRDRIPPSPLDKLFRVGTPTHCTLPGSSLLLADPGCFCRGKYRNTG